MDSKRTRRAAVKAAKKATVPFEKNLDDRDANLIEAQSKVKDAIDHIESAMLGANNWSDYETMIHFRHLLEEFLSHDHDQAGFNRYLRFCQQENS